MEKLINEDDYIMYRFQCRCLSPEDAMDISLEDIVTITMNTNVHGFWNKLKYAFDILRGWHTWREFIVREDDLKDLSDILNPDKKTSDE